MPFTTKGRLFLTAPYLGNLILALLQVIRDSQLPMPAGAVLVSPWCDLTHSFPSIHTNTKTDVMPVYGLSMQKPSLLWPPPNEELAGRVTTGLKERIRKVFLGNHGSLSHHGTFIEPRAEATLPSHAEHRQAGKVEHPVDVGSTVNLPPPHKNSQTVTLTAKNGEVLTIDQQIQFYAENQQLSHPLVSPVLAYLGGLCPLFVMASESEVLRDEIIYVYVRPRMPNFREPHRVFDRAHKAANPEKYPIKDETRALNPGVLNGIDEKYRSTPVHLQIYDGMFIVTSSLHL